MNSLPLHPGLIESKTLRVGWAACVLTSAPEDVFKTEHSCWRTSGAPKSWPLVHRRVPNSDPFLSLAQPRLLSGCFTCSTTETWAPVQVHLLSLHLTQLDLHRGSLHLEQFPSCCYCSLTFQAPSCLNSEEEIGQIFCSIKANYLLYPHGSFRWGGGFLSLHFSEHSSLLSIGQAVRGPRYPHMLSDAFWSSDKNLGPCRKKHRSL